MRWPGESVGGVVGARAPNSMRPRYAGRKKTCRAIHPAGFDAWRMDLQANGDLKALHEALREGDARRRAGSACGESRCSFKAHVKVSKGGGQKTKDPVACGLPGPLELRRPSLRKWTALRNRFDEIKARRIRRGSAAHGYVLRAQELLHRSLVRLAVSPSADAATIRRHAD